MKKKTKKDHQEERHHRSQAHQEPDLRNHLRRHRPDPQGSRCCIRVRPIGQEGSGRRGPGTFTVPGLMKIEEAQASPSHAGTNPFTGEEMMFKAKLRTTSSRSASTLKEMV